MPGRPPGASPISQRPLALCEPVLPEISFSQSERIGPVVAASYTGQDDNANIVRACVRPSWSREAAPSGSGYAEAVTARCALLRQIVDTQV
jgi:hypothetical protein